MSRPKRSETEKAKRKERVKFGQSKLRLAVPKEVLDEIERQGKVPRLVNDDEGRIQQLQERGYEFWERRDETQQLGDEDASTQTSEGSTFNRPVGRGVDGKPMRAYLMVIDKEFYEEDAALKEAENQKVDDAIRRGADPTTGNHYEDSQGNRTYAKSGHKYKP